MSLAAVSLFSGIEGFGLGFERAGMKVVTQVENDPYPTRVLDQHYPHVKRFKDVNDVGFAELGRPDLICGGFPCQDISVAGNRAGLAGSRSGLWFQFARIISEVRPRWVVIENVAGLLSSQRGRDLGTILGTLGDLGYGFAYRVLDAQHFGLAQRRKRVFIVGCLGDRTRAAEVLLDEEGSGGDLAEGRESGAVVAALTANGLGGGGPDDNLAQAGDLLALGPLSRCDASRQRWDGDTETFVAFHVTQDPISNEAVAPSLGATAGCIGVAFHENRRAEVRLTDTSGALSVGGGKPGQGYPAVLTGDMAVRRLTPLECERLQGFPDGWTACLSDTRRYRALGNAVAVPVAEWIGRRIVGRA